MRVSRSIGNQVQLFATTASAARHLAKKLPAEAKSSASQLAVIVREARALLAAQKQAEQALRHATAALNAKMKEGRTTRARTVRFIEAMFGPNSPQTRMARPKTEGRVTAPRGKRKPKTTSR